MNIIFSFSSDRPPKDNIIDAARAHLQKILSETKWKTGDFFKGVYIPLRAEDNMGISLLFQMKERIL